jgi:hypothetical protein
MALPPHDLKCPTDPSRPRPVGFDDRTGFKRYLDDLNWQMFWAGPTMGNTHLRIAPDALDVPNEQARTIVIGPDPIPLKDPRPGYQASQEAAAAIPPIPPYVIDGDT